MNEEFDALIQQIGNGLLENLVQAGVEDGQWQKAWVVIGVAPGFFGAFARYQKNNDTGQTTSLTLDRDLVLKPVKQLNKLMATEHKSRWTGAIFDLIPPTSFKADFHYPEAGEEDLDWYGKKMNGDVS